MDNFHFDVGSVGRETLKKALNLFDPPGKKVVGYSIHEEKGLILYWSDKDKDFVRLPFAMTLDQAADFASNWLEQADYGREPDHDGDNEKGFRLYTEGWGSIDGTQYGFAAIQPKWCMYGK